MPLETASGGLESFRNNLQSVAAIVLLRRFAPNDNDDDNDAGADIQAGDTRHERKQLYDDDDDDDDDDATTKTREENGRAQQAISGDLFFVAAPRSLSWTLLTPPLMLIVALLCFACSVSRLFRPSSFRCSAESVARVCLRGSIGEKETQRRATALVRYRAAPEIAFENGSLYDRTSEALVRADD